MKICVVKLLTLNLSGNFETMETLSVSFIYSQTLLLEEDLLKESFVTLVSILTSFHMNKTH